MIGPMTMLRSGTRISFRRVITVILLASWIIVPDVRGQESKAGQDQAVANLEKRGATVFRDETQPDRPVIGVDLDETEIDDQGLSNLKGLTDLQSLSMDGTPITDAGLVNLKGLTSLTDLSLDNTVVGDAGLAQLEGLKNLQKLSLDRTRVTDVGLSHLKGLKRLETLSLVADRVTDAGLVHLKGLSRLEWLLMHDTQVGDGGLEHLKGLVDLEFLFLHNTQVSDAGLEHLKGLTHLQILNVENTKVTDPGVEKFQESAAEGEDIALSEHSLCLVRDRRDQSVERLPAPVAQAPSIQSTGVGPVDSEVHCDQGTTQKTWFKSR